MISLKEILKHLFETIGFEDCGLIGYLLIKSYNALVLSTSWVACEAKWSKKHDC